MDAMLYKYKTVKRKELCTINVNEDIGEIGRILDANRNETVFVIDSEGLLYGIISIGDFLRNVSHSNCISELMNDNFAKIELEEDDYLSNSDTNRLADILFKKSRSIVQIPVVSRGMLLGAVSRNRNLAPHIVPDCSKNIDALTSYLVDVDKDFSSPLVKVCIITYNNIGFARLNLDGVLMQKTDFPFEIYIYDDCSTDGTSDIIREYASKYPNIIADIRPTNLYSTDIKLRREIIFGAQKDHNCKYVAIADGDDYWIDPYKLQSQVAFMEENSDFSMCSGGCVSINNVSGRQIVNVKNIGQASGFEYDFSMIYMPDSSIVQGFTRLYRTDVIPEIALINSYETFNDVTMTYYCLIKGKGFYFSRIFGVYNIHKGGVWGGLDDAEKCEYAFKFMDEIYRKTRDEVVASGFIQRTSNYLEYNIKQPNERLSLLNSLIEDFPELTSEFNELSALMK